MPQTLAGWILFALILFFGGASIATAVKLIMSAFGKTSQSRLEFYAAYIFGALLVVATALFIWIETPN
ncbi:hypothetical protein [Methylobacterium pseudosasicola]|uniref:Uncharacterized protein n=1 Tax=Methylobacterium pseudosasicola TaxID=582667 RepID=A0A1I4R1R0_9HYPH|nr:hypothetical protein [Methylobacterium pseudosasicola]SFM45853.1 hypothetical protein SAMN05192568_103244 [Methylobacterium pseudosasicola]